MKKTIAMLLALLLVAVMLPVTAMAAEKTVGTAEELKDAVNEATSTEETVITLNADIELDATINIESGKKVKIELNSHSIKCTNGAVFELHQGILTITGEGTVEDSNLKRAAIAVKGSQNAGDTNYSTLNVGENVTVKGFYGLFVTPFQSNAVKTAYGVEINVDGKVNAGTNASGQSGAAVYINGQIQHKNNCPVINIRSTAKLTSNAAGIYAAGYGIWNIEGEVTGATGIYAKGGVINLNGAVVYANGTYAEPQPNGNGCDSTGAAIALDSKTGYAGGIELKVSGDSEISSNFGHALEIFSTDNPETNVVDVNISGGRFAGDSEKGAVSFDSIFTEAANKSGTNVTAKITGGSFNFAADNMEAGKALLKKYIPSNMDIEDVGDSFGEISSKTITIIVPSEGGSTATTPEKNPSTGANDFVGAAVAVAVISALGAAAVVRKK